MFSIVLLRYIIKKIKIKMPIAHKILMINLEKMFKL